MRSDGWTIVPDSSNKSGTYAYGGNRWITYNEKADINRKTDFIREHNLFGAVISTLEDDDGLNRCGEGKYPIVAAVNSALIRPDDCVTTTLAPTTKNSHSTQSASTTENVIPRITLRFNIFIGLGLFLLGHFR